jgi:hypothetical protein
MDDPPWGKLRAMPSFRDTRRGFCYDDGGMVTTGNTPAPGLAHRLTADATRVYMHTASIRVSKTQAGKRVVHPAFYRSAPVRVGSYEPPWRNEH